MSQSIPFPTNTAPSPTAVSVAGGRPAVAGADPVAWLEQDHRLIRGLLEKLSAAPSAGRQQVLDDLKKLLALHNAIEENLVYPALARSAGRRDAALELYHETAEADILVFTVQQSLQHADDTLFAAASRDLTAGILKHIEVEETQAFPLLSAAPPAEVETLAEQILAFKKSLATPLTV